MADGVDFLGFDRLISELEQMGLRGEKIEDKALAANTLYQSCGSVVE
ncbi:hypothetical protein MOK16_00165 [Bacillus cereus]|nr:hypothetical protein [Bacillus cereus]MCI0757200.1 hypothetical protein [Bacillus cereus]